MRNIVNQKIYLERLAKPLQEKLKIIKYIPENAKDIIDVGCADGTVTIALAKLFPDINFLGIDLDEDFIHLAQEKSKGIKNLKFEKIYLRELLARPERFDVVIFCSVLHEFFTYGEGISSVLKALADAHELLNEDGRVIIRDMILSNYTKKATLWSSGIARKIYKVKQLAPYIHDFELRFGKLNTIYKLNHFLLKYWYTENWNREGKEHYVAVTMEDYDEIFDLLGMRVQHKEAYLIPFLKDKWMTDFDLSEDEVTGFKSTSIVVAQKEVHKY